VPFLNHKNNFVNPLGYLFHYGWPVSQNCNLANLSSKYGRVFDRKSSTFNIKKVVYLEGDAFSVNGTAKLILFAS